MVQTAVHPILSGLNAQQAQAVLDSLTQNMLVIAGAGSGKTKTSTQRMAYLIKVMGVSSYACMMLTFTNKASREMIERIAREIGEDEAKKITAGTFHSVCVRLLRKFQQYTGYDDKFVIYDESDCKAMIRDLLKEIQGDCNKQEVSEVKGQISDWKNRLLTPTRVEETMTESAWNPTLRLAWRVYTRYQQRLTKNCAYDFDDLIMRVVQLLETVPEVKAYCHERYKYIQSDEHQDTNKAQDRLLELLCGPQTNLWVVGDDAQSIYGWRGAEVKNILTFPGRFNAAMSKLEQNYRSTQTIVEAANALIAHNKGQMQKDCFSKKEVGDKIMVYRAMTADGEAQFIAQEVQNLVMWQGYGYEDFAVLYRSHSIARRLQDALTRAKIPFQVVNGLAFYEHMVIKDTIALLSLAFNPRDAVSAKRMLGKLAGVGKKTVEEIEAVADQMDVSMIDAAATWSQGKKGKAKAAIDQFLYDWQDVPLKVQVDITETIRAAWKAVRYQEYVKKEAENAEELQNNIDLVKEFWAMARAWEQKPEENDLESFLENLALVSQVDDKANPKAVKLQTLHSSKGLEFPVVFLIGNEEGVFPSKNAVTEEQMEEERRLMYVGVTRAEKLCYITHAVERPLYKDALYNPPSRFIAEIPNEYKVAI